MTYTDFNRFLQHNPDALNSLLTKGWSREDSSLCDSQINEGPSFCQWWFTREKVRMISEGNRFRVTPFNELGTDKMTNKDWEKFVQKYMNLTEIKLPKSLVCPACEKPITNASPTRNMGQPFQKGMVVICSNCTTVLQVGDSALEHMRPEQVQALSKESQAAIIQTRRVLQGILEKQRRTPRIESN